MGLRKNDCLVYAIDFGLAKQFRSANTHLHIPEVEVVNLTGTALYASINNHRNIEQSRRDDLESLAYVLIHFLRGSLPWQGCARRGGKRNRNMILTKKKNTSIDDLCHDLPTEFSDFLNYARGLNFEESPDYDYLLRLFDNLFAREGYQYDYAFDWLAMNNHGNLHSPTQISVHKINVSRNVADLPPDVLKPTIIQADGEQSVGDRVYEGSYLFSCLQH